MRRKHKNVIFFLLQACRIRKFSEYYRGSDSYGTLSKIKIQASRGNLFLTFFWRQKPFFPSFCEKPFLAFFSLWSLKLLQNALFRAYICKKFLGEPCRTQHSYRIGAHHGTAHCFMPSYLTQKIYVKKMLKNTNLWLKPCLHVTNNDDREYLWVWRHISVA